MTISPRMLDWLISGVPVYFRSRPQDGMVYATTADFSRFLNEPPLETMRLMIEKDTPASWNPEQDIRVLRRLAELNTKEMKDARKSANKS